MANIEIKREFSNMSTKECFDKCASLIETVGYSIFKKRDMASLLVCTGTLEDVRVDLNLMVPFGMTTSVTLNLSSDKLEEDILGVEAERIMDFLSKN